MPKFEVDITRTITMTQRVTVEAADEFEAQDVVFEGETVSSDFETWNVDQDSWEVDMVTEMDDENEVE